MCRDRRSGPGNVSSRSGLPSKPQTLKAGGVLDHVHQKMLTDGLGSRQDLFSFEGSLDIVAVKEYRSVEAVHANKRRKQKPSNTAPTGAIHKLRDGTRFFAENPDNHR